ncbi:MAG: CPBP family intramembrane glutamic endopeptidase [Agromyces sp.]
MGRSSPELAIPAARSLRRRYRLELALVLGLGLGQSAVYSVVALIARLTAGKPLAQQTASINPAQSTREWLDATYQLLGNLFPLVVVALALFLLWIEPDRPFERIGLTRGQLGRDVRRVGVLVALVGIPGLGVYVIGRILGLTVQVEAASLTQFWWTIPMLLLAASRAALEEEIVVIGFVFRRLEQLGWRAWPTLTAAALLRGSYHLYQGIGPFIGNVAMGFIFGWCYQRWGRVLPLVIAHFLFDAVQFVGYPVAVALWPAIFWSTHA